MASRRSATQSANLERDVARLAREHPEYVRFGVDGLDLPGWAVNPRPARRHGGNYDALEEPEIRRRWDEAVAAEQREHGRAGMAAIAVRLGVSKRTAERWKSVYGLRVGDEP